MLKPKHVASWFVVCKRGTDRQCPAWNGRSLSQVAPRAPGPHRLANPVYLLHICLLDTGSVVPSRGDAASFFDVLCTPRTLRPWFAGRGVPAGRLARALGINLRKLQEDMGDEPASPQQHGSLVLSCSTSWPLGLSCFPAVAQSVFVAALCGAGLRESSIPSDLHLEPASYSELALVCTDGRHIDTRPTK